MAAASVKKAVEEELDPDGITTNNIIDHLNQSRQMHMIMLDALQRIADRDALTPEVDNIALETILHLQNICKGMHHV